MQLDPNASRPPEQLRQVLELLQVAQEPCNVEHAKIGQKASQLILFTLTNHSSTVCSRRTRVHTSRPIGQIGPAAINT